MKISRIILKGVNNFEDFDYSFEDAWTQSVPDSLLLLGPNGSGKTTILRSISGLWQILGAFLDTSSPDHIGSNHNQPNFIYPVLWNCKLALVEIEGIFSNPLSICLGQKKETEEIFSLYRNSYRLGATWSSSKRINRHPGFQPASIEWHYKTPDNITHEQGLWFEELQELYTKNRLGAVLNLPNMIFFESEARNLLEIEDEFSVVPEQDVYQWQGRYSATTRRQGSIQNYLFTLKAVDPKNYERIRTEVNKFLANKQIFEFNKASGELMVTTDTGQTHPIHLLSSGEKQVLLMIAYIARELRPGGIVLIDEPDLHLHVSLSTAFVSYLKRVVAEQDGQLILASHAPELWDRFTDAEKVRLGATLEVGG